jgi:hypothetical protein
VAEPDPEVASNVPKREQPRRGEAVCLMCGTVVGEVRQGKFAHHVGCERPLRWQGHLPRCCRCGGSIYFDPEIMAVGPIEYEELGQLKRTGT